MWNRIKILIIKELLAIWRDKKSRVILIAPPLIQLLLFSFAANLEVKNISMAVLNNDTGKPSYELIQRFEGSKNFNKIYYVSNPNEAESLLDEQKIVLIMNINSDFSKQVENLKTADVQFILDGRRSNVSQIVQGYASRIVEQYNADLMRNLSSRKMLTRLIERNWFNQNLDYLWYTVPCMIGILSTTIGMTVTSLTVAREREFGTFDQLLVSPLTSIEILIGKTLPALLIGVFEGSLILTAGILIFRIPFEGSVIYLYIGMIIFLFAIIGVGMFISALSMTQQQAILGVFVFSVPAILLSGYATPVENMPQWLQDFTIINPVRHFLVIIKGVFLKNMSFSDVWTSMKPMIAIAIFTLSASSVLFRKRLE